jgi:hypothetical protein
VQERIVHVGVHDDADPMEVQKWVHIILIALEGENDAILVSSSPVGVWHRYQPWHDNNDSGKKADQPITVYGSHDASTSSRDQRGSHGDHSEA